MAGLDPAIHAFFVSAKIAERKTGKRSATHRWTIDMPV